MERAGSAARDADGRVALGAWIALGIVTAFGVVAAASSTLDPRGALATLVPSSAPPTTWLGGDAAFRSPDAGPTPAPNDVELATSAAAPPPDDPRVTDLVERFCVPAARTLCAARDHCCVERSPRCEDDAFASCTHLVEVIFGREDDVHPEEIEMLEVNDHAIARALRAIDGIGRHCELRGSDDDWMMHLLREPAELGEPCESAFMECRGGVCDEHAVCARAPGVGERSARRRCREGLVVGHGFVCRRPVPVGRRCFTHEECVDDLWCVRGRCRALGREGASCVYGDPPCGSGLVCNGSCERPSVWCERGECGRGEECIERSRDGPCVGDGCEGATWGGRCEAEICAPDVLLEVLGGRVGAPIAWPTP